MQRAKKFVIPCGLCVSAAVPLLAAVPLSKESQPTMSNEAQEKTLIRPSQLPIYVSEPCPQTKVRSDDCPPNAMEEGFGMVRRSLQGLLSEYSTVTENFNNKISTGYEHSMLMLDYLREESNIMPRLGAVGIGGLTGLVFSLRGGKFKRFVYTGTGASLVAAVCYPKQAQEAFTLAKHYANIGYNFVYGVKPGDSDQLEITWPELPKINVPTSSSEFFNLAVDTGSSLISLIGSLAGKAVDAITENTESNVSDTTPKPKDK